MAAVVFYAANDPLDYVIIVPSYTEPVWLFSTDYKIPIASTPVIPRGQSVAVMS